MHRAAFKFQVSMAPPGRRRSRRPRGQRHHPLHENRRRNLARLQHHARPRIVGDTAGPAWYRIHVCRLHRNRLHRVRPGLPIHAARQRHRGPNLQSGGQHPHGHRRHELHQRRQRPLPGLRHLVLHQGEHGLGRLHHADSRRGSTLS